MQEKINALLPALDRERRLLFGVQVLKRLEPHYLHYVESEELDDDEWIPQALSVAELFFNDKKEAETIAAELLEEIVFAEPDSEDTPIAARATYSLNACFDVLELITQDDPESAVSVSGLAISAAGTENKAEEEICFQLKLIEKLQSSAPLAALVKEAFEVPGQRPPADA